MKGISYITDTKNRVKAMVVDLKTIKQNEKAVHESISILIAESRKNDKTISWEAAKKRLKAETN